MASEGNGGGETELVIPGENRKLDSGDDGEERGGGWGGGTGGQRRKPWAASSLDPGPTFIRLKRLHPRGGEGAGFQTRQPLLPVPVTKSGPAVRPHQHLGSCCLLIGAVNVFPLLCEQWQTSSVRYRAVLVSPCSS